MIHLLHEQRQNPPKTQEADETYTYEYPNNYYHNAQVRVKATDPIMVKPATGNFKGSCIKTEVKDPSIANDSFKIIAIREVQHSKIVFNMATIANPIFRETMRTVTEAEAMAVDLTNLEDAVMAGLTFRIAMKLINISITHMTKNQNNMVLPAVYVADSTIHPSIVTRENMT